MPLGRYLLKLNNPNLREHQPALDGLRGVAIMLVLLHHCGLIIPLGADSGFWQLASGLTALAQSGVDLFFVLSGFLITNILIQSKGHAHYFLNFYMRRTLRIFPLYYAALAAAFFILRWFWSPAASAALHQGWFWPYLQNWFVVREGVWPDDIRLFSHFWSLAVEEQFYLFWPLLIYFTALRGTLSWSIFFVVMAPALRLYFLMQGDTAPAIYVNTLMRMDALALGAGIAIFGNMRGALTPLARPFLAIGLAAVAGIVAVRVRTHQFGPTFLMQTAGYSFLAAMYGAILIWTMVAPPESLLGKAMTARFTRGVGKYSYGMYVFHWPVMLLLADFLGCDQRLFAPSLRVPFYLGFLLASGLVTFAIAFGSWHLYEKRFLRLKHFFPR